MTFIEALIGRSKKIIDRWNGRHAKMLELTRSHQSLRIQVLGNSDRENLVISLLGPLHINGPTSWSDCSMSLSPEYLSDGTEGVLLTDEKHGVRIVAVSFEVAENVKL